EPAATLEAAHRSLAHAGETGDLLLGEPQELPDAPRLLAQSLDPARPVEPCTRDVVLPPHGCPLAVPGRRCQFRKSNQPSGGSAQSRPAGSGSSPRRSAVAWRPA